MTQFGGLLYPVSGRHSEVPMQSSLSRGSFLGTLRRGKVGLNHLCWASGYPRELSFITFGKVIVKYSYFGGLGEV